MSADIHGQLEEALSRQPFAPFAIRTTDGRRIAVEARGQAVLNSQAISVVEAAFSVTVIGIPQIDVIEEPA
ncbi:MAG TPA: hypothetical protein VIM61_16130 [Chthoniobacterales bacterium]|jgi:hypothetical protein